MKTRIFVPGRVACLGEHSDCAATHRSSENTHIHPGVCLAYCTDCGIELEGEITKVPASSSSSSKKKLPPILHYTFANSNSSSEEAGEEILIERTVPLTLEALDEYAKQNDFFAYICGTAAEMIHRYGEDLFSLGETNDSNDQEQQQQQQTLVTIRCTSMTLPMKKGLSSSAAISVGLARLLSTLSSMTNPTGSPFASEQKQEKQEKSSAVEEKGEISSPLSVQQEMDIAYAGELRTGSKCGRLDQVCAYPSGTFVRLDFNGPSSPKCTEIKVKHAFYFVVCDLNAQKDTKKILQDLSSAFPHPQNEIDQAVHDALGPHNQRLVSEAEKALESGNSLRLGEIFSEAQKIFDTMVAPKCPEELNAPRLHEVLEHPEVNENSLGRKGVGSQGDGSCQFVCKDVEQQGKLCEVLLKLKCTPMKFSLTPSSPS